MKRVGVYSASRKPRPAAAPPVQPKPAPRRRRISLKAVLTGAFVVAMLAAAGASWLAPRGIGREEADALIAKAVESIEPPFSAADAFEKVLPAVVLVRGFGEERDDGYVKAESTGTGVVIVDNGIILTNLHVVHGAKRVQLTFSDGLESEAAVIGTQPENDLAVLKAAKIPDDLFAATLRSTTELKPGEPVVAVGFPFGIGPSASSGVVSGLKREYRSTSGERILTNLIQFDAAVNPGNSGGPLVTAEGEVVGIVTGLLNPTEQRVFIGIGFAVPIENAASAVGLSPF
ncbi:MAG: S1C family serine protease [Betaproteobacteria bacterium]